MRGKTQIEVSEINAGDIGATTKLQFTETKDTPVFNINKGEIEKLGGLYVMRGKTQIEVSEINAGDIGATTKLQFTETGDALIDKNHPVKYKENNKRYPCF